jgi:hypothetical protein
MSGATSSAGAFRSASTIPRSGGSSASRTSTSAGVDDYLDAYEDTIAETSTDWAPWYVVPADRNWLKALAVAELLSATLMRMDPQLPEPDPGIEGLRIE